MQSTPLQPRALAAFLRMALLAGFLSAALLVWVSVLAIRHYLPNEIEQRNRILLQMMEQQMESFQVQNLHELRHLRRILQDSISETHDFLARSFLRPEGLFDGFHVVDSTGVVTLLASLHPESQSLNASDLSGFPFFRQWKKGDTLYWSPVFLSPFNDAPSTTLSLTMGNQILSAHISLEGLRSALESLHLGAPTRMLLLDQRGAYIYHPDPHRVQEREVFPLFSRSLPQVDGIWHFASYHWADVDYSVQGRLLPQSGWSVVMLQATREMSAPVRDLIQSLVGVAILLALVMALFVFLAHRRFYGPIRNLLSRMNESARGVYPQVLPQERYLEFQQLADGFLGMVRSIDQREEELRTMNEQLGKELDAKVRAEAAFQAIMHATSQSTGEELFSSLVVALARWLGVEIAFLAQRDGDELCVLSTVGADGIKAGQRYGIAGTPFQKTLDLGFYCLGQGVCDEFPTDFDLRSLGAYSYVGVAVRSAQGQPIGVLGAISKDILSLPPRARDVMPILAMRLSAEFARSQSQAALLRMNHHLQDLTKSLSSKNKELEGMVYIASHDLRAPLVNISGFSRELVDMQRQVSQWALQVEGLPAELRKILENDIPECVRYISGSVSRMDQLLAGLLRFSRVGRGDLVSMRTPLGPILAKVVADLDYSLRQCGGEVEVAPLPTVVGSEEDLLQIFSNLLNNAIKYRRLEAPPRIIVKGILQGQEAILSVQDNGRGISSRHLNKVFDIFYRGDVEPSVSGEGLGLSIVQKIVDRLGGSIRMHSTEGEGSRVEVTLRME